MQSTLPVAGVALTAVAVGAGLYFYMPMQSPNSVPSTITPSTPVATSTASVGTGNMPVQPSTSKVAFRVLDTGTHAAGVSARKNYAGYSEEGFIKLWEMAHGTDGTALPKIDFSKEYVIGVFAGQKSTGGHGINVTSVTDTGTVRTVAVTLTSPGEGCMVTQALTNPYQIVVVPVSDATLAHTNIEVSTACN